MIRILCFLSVIPGLLTAVCTANGQDAVWRLENDTNDTVIVHIWPASELRFNNPSYRRLEILAQKAGAIQVAKKDPYHVHVQIETGGLGSGKYVFVPSLEPVDLFQIASTEQQPFSLRTALALKNLPGGIAAAEGTAIFTSRARKISLGDMEGFRAELERSSWRTEFVSKAGERIPADLKFDVSKGTFRTPNFTGAISGVAYAYDRDTFIIDGRWGRSGPDGQFVESGVFRFKGSRKNPTAFTGEWSDKGLMEWRAWNGTRR